MDIATTALGFVAGILTTLSFLPQVIRTWRTRSAKDLSLPMLIASTGGLTCGALYGLWIDSIPITLTNVVTSLLAGTNLWLKLRYG
jgi:MtN3 and saliva related transmembrane protein